MDLFTVLISVVLGSGAGGIIGAYATLKQVKNERASNQEKHTVDLKSIDVEQFKALFPGGLGDAVEHWRDEAKRLYEEVEKLRTQRYIDHKQILDLKLRLSMAEHTLTVTRSHLSEAENRIQELETK